MVGRFCGDCGSALVGNACLACLAVEPGADLVRTEPTVPGQRVPATRGAPKIPAVDVSDSYIKDSKLTVDQGDPGAGTVKISDTMLTGSRLSIRQSAPPGLNVPTPPLSTEGGGPPAGGASAAISDSYIANSTLNIDQSAYYDHSIKNILVQDPGAAAERELRRSLSEQLAQRPEMDVGELQVMASQAAEACGVPKVEALRIARELYAAQSAQYTELLQAQRVAKVLCVVDQQGMPMFPGTISADELVQYLNGHPDLAFAPRLRSGGNPASAISVWESNVVLEHPDAKAQCSQTLQSIALRDIRTCQQCGRPFGPQATLVGGLCSDCFRLSHSPVKPALPGDAGPARPEELDGEVWAHIPAGTFLLGSPDDEDDRDDDERQYSVTITRSLWMLRLPVSEAYYRRLVGDGEGGRVDIAMVQVSWLDAIAFCNAMSRRLGHAGCYEMSGGAEHLLAVNWVPGRAGIRLPTEAEWEFACRAGSTGPFYSGIARHQLQTLAVFDTEQLEALGTRVPNAWGLHDMLGSVWEWVWDGRGAYPEGPTADPQGNPKAVVRVLRGGSFIDEPSDCRCAKRFYAGRDKRADNFGFRVVFDEGE